jgi:uncharacterized membrane protein
MLVLIFGVALWMAVHFWKRAAPDHRASLGPKGKIIVAVGSGIAIVLMVIGYRAWDGTVYWDRSNGLVWLNNLLMVAAFYVYATGGPGPGRPRVWLGRKLRHPQLTGFSLFAVAHLLVNGDTPSFVLFGGLLVWAVASVVIINRAQPAWTPPPSRAAKKELIPIVAILVIVPIVSLIHTWLGYNPFG